MIVSDIFGTLPDGRAVKRYTLRQGPCSASVIEYGARLTALCLPRYDSEGYLTQTDDVVLGYDELADYLTDTANMGATVGPVANRIDGASFSLNGKTFPLTANDGANCLHGGSAAFSEKLWSGCIVTGDQLLLTYVAEDGEGGFPGRRTVEVLYSLTWEDDYTDLFIGFRVQSDKDTPLSLTNHAYFHLDGEAAGHAERQKLQLQASAFLPVRSDLIPTGERRAVLDTPFDFTKPRSVDEKLNDDDEQLRLAGGYDHCFLLDPSKKRHPNAVLYAPASGREMALFTDMPGLQLYTGNFLAGVRGKGGRSYEKHAGLCLEPEQLPDALHHSAFPSPIVKAEEPYTAYIEYCFQQDSGEPHS